MGDTARQQDDFDTSVEPGVWRYVRASRASVIVDAEDYFELMQQAMLRARDRIMLVGWDFDTRIHLAQGRRWFGRRREGRYPRRLGSFIAWLTRHRPELDVRILKWGYGFRNMVGRGTMFFDLARWVKNPQIDFKFDTAHPFGCSHHQKIAVLDEALAVCGGIDMTTCRWDTREHRENDRARKRPRGRYYGPWHDATMMIEGDAARALADLSYDRWQAAGGKRLERVTQPGEGLWPERLEAQFENVELGIARNRPAHGGRPAIEETEQLFIRHVMGAKRYIYAESQYFASRVVAEAIARRLEEPDPPEFVIVNPISADGWIETQAMDHARARLIRAIGRHDRRGRFNVYVPYTGDEPIYVHAKVMIVDDAVLRIGSANLNNRSLGLDSECCVFVDSARPGNGHCTDAIRALRLSLLGEHLGLDEAALVAHLEAHETMASAIRHAPLRSRRLRPLELGELTELERTLADSELLDPETPDEMFDFAGRTRALFRDRGFLKPPRAPFRRRKKR